MLHCNMNKKSKNNDREVLSIDHEFEPWTRKWVGGMGYHTYKNQVGGAFSKTKREYQLQMEQQNRKNKMLRQKNKSK
jgi:hypothetical protein